MEKLWSFKYGKRVHRPTNSQTHTQETQSGKQKSAKTRKIDFSSSLRQPKANTWFLIDNQFLSRLKRFSVSVDYLLRWITDPPVDYRSHRTFSKLRRIDFIGKENQASFSSFLLVFFSVVPSMPCVSFFMKPQQIYKTDSFNSTSRKNRSLLINMCSIVRLHA